MYITGHLITVATRRFFPHVKRYIRTMASGSQSACTGGSPAAEHLVGFHVSSAGGIWPAVLRAKECNARAMAFFTRSNQRWECPELKEADASKFISLCSEHGYGPHAILPHGSYLTNLGSGDPAMREKSLKAMIDEVSRCKQLGLRLYNFHPGAASGGCTREQCTQHIAEGINAVHAAVPDVCLVIENMAGQGSVVGVTLEEIRDIIAGVTHKDRVGVCIDTAHAHGAGIDVSTPQALDKLLADFESVIGLKYLRGMHLNDSRALLGSRRDLHQNIGRGHIGIEGFRAIMNEKRLAGIPLILETPCPNGSETQIYRDEIALLYGLVGTSTGQQVTLPELESPTAKAAKAGGTKSFKANMDENGKIPSTPGSGKRRKGQEDEGEEQEEEGPEGGASQDPNAASLSVPRGDTNAEEPQSKTSKGRKRKTAAAGAGADAPLEGTGGTEGQPDVAQPADVRRKRTPKAQKREPAPDTVAAGTNADLATVPWPPGSDTFLPDVTATLVAPVTTMAPPSVPGVLLLSAQASARVVVKPSKGKKKSIV